ncbi:MAG: hypothetical protein ACTMHX_07400 [Bifidobacterium mongoliense]|jgi:hypothetical protein
MSGTDMNTAARGTAIHHGGVRPISIDAIRRTTQPKAANTEASAAIIATHDNGTSIRFRSGVCTCMVIAASPIRDD